MSTTDEKIRTYEAKVWQHGEVWKAKLLCDGIQWSIEQEFETRAEAIAAMRDKAAGLEAEDAAERTAERIAL